MIPTAHSSGKSPLSKILLKNCTKTLWNCSLRFFNSSALIISRQGAFPFFKSWIMALTSWIVIGQFISLSIWLSVSMSNNGSCESSSWTFTDSSELFCNKPLNNQKAQYHQNLNRFCFLPLLNFFQNNLGDSEFKDQSLIFSVSRNDWRLFLISFLYSLLCWK